MKLLKFFDTQQEAQAYIDNLMFVAHWYDTNKPYWCNVNSVWVVEVRSED